MVLSVTLDATHNTISFLKSPGQELSESVVLFNGTQKFARLDFREVCENMMAVNLQADLCTESDMNMMVVNQK